MSELRDRLQQAIGDSYRIERELGGGGMSYVFLAVEKDLNRRVVIKVLAPELTNEVMTARFRREMEVTALLQHPHILPVLTTGAKDGLLYYVAPFVEGESLRHRLKREPRQPVEDVVRILSELSSALAYAHERGVVHRDIKPENILLSNGLAVLADFGISGVLTGRDEADGGARLTDVGISMGTPGYMSPEQAAGERALDGRSDQYSLAIVGYEMLTGQPPFTGPTPLSVMTAHLTETPKPIQGVRPDVPSGLSAALARALAKRPEERFATAAAFRQALGVSYSGGAPAVHVGTTRRNLIGATVLAVAAIAAFVALRPRGAPGLDDSLVAIAPFDVVGADDAMWREGLVDLLAANIDGAGPLRTVSPSVIVRQWGSARADRESAMTLGTATQAGITVFGSVLSSGRDSVRVRATVLDTRAGSVIGRPIDYADESARLDRISDSLTFAILNRLNEARGLGATRSASLGTSSVAAMKEYLVGEQFYRRGDWDSATVHFRGAVEADSLFAPALRRLGNAIGWKLNPDLQIQREGYALQLRAGTLNVGLAPRESLLVSADSIFAALFIGGLPQPQRYRLTNRLTDLLEDGAERFSNDPEVWFKLGDVLSHFTTVLQPSRANAGDVREAFVRSLELDSAFGPSYIHYLGLAAAAQDHEELRRRLRAFLALNPQDNQGDAARYVMRLVEGTARADDSRDSTFERMPLSTRVNVFATMFPLLDTTESQVALTRRNLADVRARGLAPNAVNAQLQLMAALGMRGHYAEAISLSNDNSRWIYAEASLAGAVPPDSAGRVFGQALEDHNLQVALQGAFHWAMVGDTTRLKRVIETMEPIARQNPGAVVPFPLLRGLLATARGDTATAIREFTVPDSSCIGWCMQARYPLARVLAASGRDSAAAVLLDEDWNQPTGLWILWMLERGRVNERLGRTAKAIDAYGFVVDAWARGDSSVQPVVREARAGLDRLGADRPRR